MNRIKLLLSQSAEDDKDLLFGSHDSMETTQAAMETSNDTIIDSKTRFHEQSSYTPKFARATLTWENVQATLGERCILEKVSGLAKAGELLAIMGESGAGKTTLLNVVGGRSAPSNLSIVSGAVQLNGVPLSLNIVRNYIGFVHQDDILPPLLTVREYLWFHAKMRMTKNGTTDEARRRRVEALLLEMNLTKCGDTLIGNPELGEKTLSGGERKRLSLASELIVNPAILCLDEPTSGLDSFMAETVVQSLRNLAKQAGKTVVFTVHQPSSQIFSYFDRILLLSNGEVCFHGTAADCGRFFASPPLSLPCPDNFNPADFYMDVICRRFRDSHKLISGSYMSSEFSKIVQTEIATANYGLALRNSVLNVSGHEMSSNAAPISTQLKMTTWRAAKVYYRSPFWIWSRLFDAITYPVLIGLVFMGLGLDPLGVANRCGMLVQITGLNAWPNVDQFACNLPTERPTLLRECAAGLYSPWVYFIARQAVELPFLFFLSCVVTTISYTMTLLFQTTGLYGWAIAVATGYLISLAASSIGYIFGFMTENPAVLASVSRPIVVALSLCNGFWINMESIPGWLSWLPYLSVFYYGNENVFIGEWYNVTLPDCSNFDFLNTNSPSSELQCYNNGADVLEYYNFNVNHLGRNFGLLVALAVSGRLIALAILAFRTRRAITPRIA